MAGESRAQRRFGSHRSRRRLVYVGIGILALGVVAAIFAFGPNRNSKPETFSSLPATTVPTPVKVPFSAEARHVALRFVQTAVARKHLDEAWNAVTAADVQRVAQKYLVRDQRTVVVLEPIAARKGT